jgi:hypothetical protein
LAVIDQGRSPSINFILIGRLLRRRVFRQKRSGGWFRRNLATAGGIGYGRICP